MRAGWCIALAYLFCVLAPSLSFAFSDGTMAAPCLFEDLGLDAHEHEHADVKQAHDEHAADMDMMHDHDSSLAGIGANVQPDAALPAKAPDKDDDGHCCGLIPMSAIPAAEIVLVKPTAITSFCEPVIYRDVADNTPPRLYRPPIS